MLEASGGLDYHDVDLGEGRWGWYLCSTPYLEPDY